MLKWGKYLHGSRKVRTFASVKQTLTAMKEKKTCNHIYFTTRGALLSVAITYQRIAAIKRLTASNYHTNARLSIAKAFNIKWAIALLKDIQRCKKHYGYMTYGLLNLRKAVTDKMLNEIGSLYGEDAKTLAISLL